MEWKLCQNGTSQAQFSTVFCCLLPLHRFQAFVIKMRTVPLPRKPPTLSEEPDGKEPGFTPAIPGTVHIDLPWQIPRKVYSQDRWLWSYLILRQKWYWVRSCRPRKVHVMCSSLNVVHSFLSLGFLFNFKHTWEPGNRNGLLGMDALGRENSKIQAEWQLGSVCVCMCVCTCMCAHVCVCGVHACACGMCMYVRVRMCVSVCITVVIKEKKAVDLRGNEVGIWDGDGERTENGEINIF